MCMFRLDLKRPILNALSACGNSDMMTYADSVGRRPLQKRLIPVTCPIALHHILC
jgi:hypothetical protein